MFERVWRLLKRCVCGLCLLTSKVLKNLAHMMHDPEEAQSRLKQDKVLQSSPKMQAGWDSNYIWASIVIQV